MDPRPHCGFHYFAVCGVRLSVADILHYCAGEQKDVLLDDADVLAKALLGEVADVIAVHRDAAAGDVVKAGYKMAHGGLAAAGFADQGYCFAGRDVKVNVVQDLCPVVVGEGDVFKADGSFYIGQYFGVGSVLNLRLSAHKLHEAVKSGHALGIDLHKLHELANGRGERGYIECEGDQVDIVHPALHDQKAADRDDGDLHQADCGFDARVEQAHGAVEGDLAVLEGLIGSVELLIFGFLVGKSFGSADA